MFRWNLMLRKVFASPPPVRNTSKRSLFAWLRGQLKTWCQPIAAQAKELFTWMKAQRRKPTVKPTLQQLDARILPSASATNQLAGNAPMTSAFTAQVSAAESLLETAQEIKTQLVTTVVHNMQAVYSDWLAFAASENPLFAALLNNSDTSSTAPQNAGSGSGSGSGAMTTAQNAENQQLKLAAPQAGSGSGSGATTTVQEGSSKQRILPLTGSGSGSAIVTGSVWLEQR